MDGTAERADELRTSRLVIRPLRPTDVDRLAEIANDRRIARNMTTAFPHPYTPADAESFIGSDPDALAIAVRDGAEPTELIGVVGSSIHQADDPAVLTFGYWLGVDHWGMGYVTEAARAYVDHLITGGNLRRIEASVYGWNPGSGRVLEKLGFELEGRLRSRVERFGDVTDELIYGLVL